MTWKLFHFLVVAIAGWMNRQQQVIEHLRPQNQVLPEKPGHKRIILSESQKVRLATAVPGEVGVDEPLQAGLDGPVGPGAGEGPTSKERSLRKLKDTVASGPRV